MPCEADRVLSEGDRGPRVKENDRLGIDFFDCTRVELLVVLGFGLCQQIEPWG